jgi:PhnB protein
MPTRPIPEGYHAVTPYLVVNGAAKVIGFLERAFGAKLAYEPVKRPDGKIMHADVKISDSHVMIADENEWAKATTTSLYVYAPDVDATYRQALKSGGESVMEPADMFYGDRTGCVKDPAGNNWNIATHKEDIAPQELAKRAQEFMKEHQKSKVA